MQSVGRIGGQMNWLKRKFWMWWFFSCPVGYSFMGHENGKAFWFYPIGVNIRYKRDQYISLHLRERPTQRALDLLSRLAKWAGFAQSANQ
jgi:hypothetical protein